MRVLLMLAAAVLTGCTSAPPPPSPSPTPSSTPSSTPSPVTWPNTVLPGVDCGTFVYDQGERRSTSTASCLVGAKTPAHLIETRPTIEGAPITTYYLTDDQGRTTVLVDARKDMNGRVAVQTCDRTRQEREAILMDDCTPEANLWPFTSRSYRSVDWDALYLLAVDRECLGRTPYPDRPDLQGLTVAQARAAQHGTIRVIGQDGACNDHTEDLRADRTNVYVRNGTIAWAQLG